MNPERCKFYDKRNKVRESLRLEFSAFGFVVPFEDSISVLGFTN